MEVYQREMNLFQRWESNCTAAGILFQTVFHSAARILLGGSRGWYTVNAWQISKTTSLKEIQQKKKKKFEKKNNNSNKIDL